MKKPFTIALVLTAFLSAWSFQADAQWVQTNGPYGGDVWSLAVSGTNLFAATNSGGVFLSTNNGTSWTAVNNGLTDSDVQSLAVSGTNLFAGTVGGVFLSNNNGASWIEVNNGLTDSYVQALAVSGTNLFAGTWGGVFLSTNNGASWSAVNTGLTNSLVLSLAVSGTNLFAGTSRGGVWRRPLSEMITSVERTSTDLPAYFSLEQNYPNPFNPSTTISFNIPQQSHVKLVIYDVLGRDVRTLVDEEKQPGRYSVSFDASNLPSGVYLYRLQAGNFSEVRKMVVMK